MDYKNIEIDVLNAAEGFKAVSKFFTSHSPKKIQELIEGLYSFAKFEVDDRVALNATPKISEEKGWGWLGAKHFLVEGECARVCKIEWRGDLQTFCYHLMFDNESWLDKNGIPQKVSKTALYYFAENWLVKTDKIKPETLDPPKLKEEISPECKEARKLAESFRNHYDSLTKTYHSLPWETK